MPVFTQGPRAAPPWLEGALPCWASTVPEGPALQENCPVCPAAASLQRQNCLQQRLQDRSIFGKRANE